jgi:hypothetical protein
MITVGEKTIKLQIWDTVPPPPYRPDRKASNLSRAATIAQQQEPSWSTTSPAGRASAMSHDGSNRPRSTATQKWSSWSSATSATCRASNSPSTQSKSILRGGGQIRQRTRPHLSGGFGKDRLPGRGGLQEECGNATRENLERRHQHRQ